MRNEQLQRECENDEMDRLSRRNLGSDECGLSEEEREEMLSMLDGLSQDN